MATGKSVPVATGIFTGKSVPLSVREELTKRASIKGTDDWFASRTNWVSIRSFCTNCGDGPGSTKFLSTFKNPAYSDNSMFQGLRPNPVVESVQVKGQGNLGTTRSCTIKIIAFTQEQLNSLVDCYAVPSMSIRVQFGWNKDAQGNLTPAALNSMLANNPAICEMNQIREINPSYEGLQGIVGKYGISFNKDSMWWELTLEIIAASSPVLARPLQDFTNTCKCETTSVDLKTGENKTSVKKISQFRAAILGYIKKAGNVGFDQAAGAAKTYGLIDVGDVGLYSIHLNRAIRDELGGSPGYFSWAGLKNMAAGVIGTAECNEAYITFGKLEKLVSTTSFSTTKEGKSIMGKFDSEAYGLISYKIPTFSSDPDVCLLPGRDTPFAGGYEGIQDADPCIVDNESIDLKKILVNCIFLNKCLDDIGDEGSLQDFFEKVLTGISNALANICELSIIDDGKCGTGANDYPTLSVIDLQKFKSEVKAYLLPVGPTKAVLRDIKLELQLPDAMKSQALNAGLRKQTNGKPCDEIRFTKEMLMSGEKPPPRDFTLPKKEEVKPAEPNPPCPTDCNKEDEEKEPDVYSAWADLVSELTDQNKEALRNLLIKSNSKGADKDICKNMIVPYEFSFTTDGIGGFAFGQLVTCDILPTSNTEKYHYQITAVEHNVTYGDWTTTVSTKARYK